VILKLLVATDPFHSTLKPLQTPSFCQRLFDYWEIRFGRFPAWAR